MERLTEIWLPIKGYENFYEVSNTGKVRSLDRHVKYKLSGLKLIKGKILKQGLVKSGYYTVALLRNGIQKTFTVHRLVAETFIKNPYSFTYVNHKDEVKTNNNINNLEWCTPMYNNSYSGIGGHNKKKVYQFDKSSEIINIFESTCEAAKILGFNQSNISANCRGKYKQVHGYIFSYKEAI